MTTPSLGQLARSLGGEVNGDAVLAPGPDHSPADRSLSIKPDAGNEAGFVVHSFAGDDPIVCRDYVRAKLGLPPFEPRKAKTDDGNAWKLIKEHIYRDEHGQPYLRIRKCWNPKKGRKEYPQAHWNGSAWVNGAPKGPRIPYELPALKAAKPEVPIIIAEGEQCCDALRKLGFVATCNPGGAEDGKGTKWTADLNKWFEGRHVVLMPDNDNPGWKHVVHVARQLQGIAASIKLADLSEHWPGPDPMAKGDDVADFIEQHDRAGSRLARLVREAPDCHPAAIWSATVSSMLGRSDAGSDSSDSSDPDDEKIEALAKLSLLEYAKRRKDAAEQIGISLTFLDRLVQMARPKSEDDDSKLQGRTIELSEPVPWTEPVDGAELLTKVADTIRQHVVMTETARDIAALWCVYTHLSDAFQISPRLVVRAPTKRCGKTTLLDVLGNLVLRPLPSVSISPAVVFRVIEEYRPTLLIDEAAALKRNIDLKEIINGGHRRGFPALRTVGENHQPRAFDTFAPCAIALIGTLPDDLHDRCVVVDLKRRLASEEIKPFRLDRVEHLRLLARKIARWTTDHAVAVGAAEPDMPDGIINREADNWRPLLAIADTAGGPWRERARQATLQGHKTETDSDGLLSMLLGDISKVFAEKGEERLSSLALSDGLILMEGRPWAEFGRKQLPLSQNQLARLLKPLGIAPGAIWINAETVRGYELAHFREAFERYLPPESPSDPPEGGSQPLGCKECDEIRTSDVFQTVRPEPDLTVGKCEKPNNGGISYTLTVAKGGLGGKSVNGGARTLVCAHCGGPEGHTKTERFEWLATPDGPEGGTPVHRRCTAEWYRRATAEPVPEAGAPTVESTPAPAPEPAPLRASAGARCVICSGDSEGDKGAVYWLDLGDGHLDPVHLGCAAKA